MNTFGPLVAILWLLASIACLGTQHPLGQHASHPPTRVTVRLTSPASAQDFDLFVACTEQQRATGLMHRRTLAPAQGMIFFFEDEAPRSFWMHNTPLPLDLLFFNRKGQLVCVIDHAEPNTGVSRTCELPTSAVVELAAGTAAARRLGPSTLLSVHDLASVCPGAAAP